MRRAQGFTLVELMVTVAILAILVGVAVPSFKSFGEGQRVRSAAAEITTSILSARSEAVKRNTSVTLAPDTADAWAGGWTVKYGANLVHQQAAFTNLTITGAPSTITFGGSGRPDTTGSFQITANQSVRCVRLDASGLPTTKSEACS